jgi:hypothetical protein
LKNVLLHNYMFNIKYPQTPRELVKSPLTLLLTTGAIFSLNACGTPPQKECPDGPTQGQQEGGEFCHQENQGTPQSQLGKDSVFVYIPVDEGISTEQLLSDYIPADDAGVPEGPYTDLT